MKLKNYSSLEVLTVVFSILVVIGTGLAVIFVEKGGEVADYINLAAIIGLTTYVFLKSYSTSEDMKNLKERMSEVEPNVKINTQDLNKIKDWVHLIEPTILSHSYSQKISNEEEFNIMLVRIASNNKNMLQEMIKGRFIFSSDVFTDYWIPLLRNESVKFYHSTAIIKDKDYFVGNGLNQMLVDNAYLSTLKPIKLLWFIHNDIISDPDLMKEIKTHKDSIISNGTKKNIEIKVARLERLTNANKKDFGIAGKLAYAILNQDPDEGKEKYILDYNNSNLHDYEKIFATQEENITVNGEIEL